MDCAAGTRLKDMLVFDRYGLEFRTAGYHQILPDDVARGELTPIEWDPGQLAIDFDVKKAIAGYDR